MVLPGLRLTHTLHRRYENAWEQIGTLGAGAYTQQGYGTGGVIALGYGRATAPTTCSTWAPW